MEIYIYSLGSVILVSLISLIGAFTISIREDLLKKYVFVLVALAVGALLGDVFLHLLPEAYAEFENKNLVSIFIIVGILIFFIFEKFLHWHHHDHDCKNPHPVGKMILFSDGMHNFIDGLIIGASYLVSIEIGIATTLAIILHEIPQEIGDFGVLIHSGYTKTKALLYNFISALFSIVGVLFVFTISKYIENITTFLIPIASGGFVYIALSDLVPELQKSNKTSQSILQLVSIAVGVGSMALLLFLE